MSDSKRNQNIGISENKLKHSLGVARKMKEMCEAAIESKIQRKGEDMFVLGLVHDIGYEFAKKSEDHATIGGMILNRQGYQYWKEVLLHGDPDTDYHSDALLLLNIADLSIDAEGNDVGVKRRLEDIGNRYGKESDQFLKAERLAKKIGLIPDPDRPIQIPKARYMDLNKLHNIIFSTDMSGK